jgi:hypothetical protein
MKIRVAAKGRKLFRLAAAALLATLALAPQIATAEAVGYPETRDRLLGLSDQVGDQVDRELSRLPHPGYRDSYDENVVGSLLVPERTPLALLPAGDEIKLLPANTGGPPARGFSSGRAGEIWMTEHTGGVRGGRNTSFFTRLGLRKPDIHRADGLLIESKVGYVRYSKFARKQILKDRNILRRGLMNRRGLAPNEIEWHFFRSKRTGKVGADPRILKMLDRAGIKYRIWN